MDVRYFKNVLRWLGWGKSGVGCDTVGFRIKLAPPWRSLPSVRPIAGAICTVSVSPSLSAGSFASFWIHDAMSQWYDIDIICLNHLTQRFFFSGLFTTTVAYAGHTDILSAQFSGQCSEPDGTMKHLDLKRSASEGATESRAKHNTVLGKQKWLYRVINFTLTTFVSFRSRTVRSIESA